MKSSTMYPPARYKQVGTDFPARWAAGEAERVAKTAEINTHFDRHRDAALAKMWAADEAAEQEQSA